MTATIADNSIREDIALLRITVYAMGEHVPFNKGRV